MLQIIISLTECRCQCQCQGDVTDHHQSDLMSVPMSVSWRCYRSSSVWLNVIVNVSVSVMSQIIISLTECQYQCQCQCDVTDHYQSYWVSVTVWCYRSSSVWLNVSVNVSVSVMSPILISLTESFPRATDLPCFPFHAAIFIRLTSLFPAHFKLCKLSFV